MVCRKSLVGCKTLLVLNSNTFGKTTTIPSTTPQRKFSFMSDEHTVAGVELSVIFLFILAILFVS